MNDKNSTGIWNTIIQMNSFGEELFPSKLVSFLETDKIKSGEWRLFPIYKLAKRGKLNFSLFI
ncbi:hypothetical protein [Clostridium sp. ZBS15]|uniref:hypothetical protein n=1 Tax=Clostridium sp. ZBS15 TaxID=2949969 RepID=UPI002079FCEF|nr:hypothetical protein [Clostridium sp. ZBS15]